MKLIFTLKASSIVFMLAFGCIFASYGMEQQLSKADRKLINSSDQGDIKKAEAALIQGATLYARDHNGMQALHHAASSGQTAMVAWLLERGALIDSFSSDGYRPLHYAVMNGNLTTIRLLLANGADAHEEATMDHSTPFELSVSAQAKKLLIEYGAEVPANVYKEKSYAKMTKLFGSQLLGAIALHDQQEISRIIADLAKKELSQEERRIINGALGLAAAHVDLNLMRFIFTHFSSVIDPDALRQAFIASALTGVIESIDLMWEFASKKGENFQDPLWQSAFNRALLVAAVQGREEIVKLILDRAFTFDIDLGLTSVGSLIRMILSKYSSRREKKIFIQLYLSSFKTPVIR